ncbi:hypothetical protein EPB69_11560 [Geobacillus stearothermophilus]|nr:hypothetical protein EPB69_11560 [Geobacillus stearothermophilus]
MGALLDVKQSFNLYSFIFVFSGVLIFVCLNPRQEETRSFPQTKDDKYYGQIVGQTVGSRGYVTITVK